MSKEDKKEAAPEGLAAAWAGGEGGCCAGPHMIRPDDKTSAPATEPWTGGDGQMAGCLHPAPEPSGA